MLLIEPDYFEHSEILGWRVAKYGKIIFNGLFQKKSVFQIKGCARLTCGL